MRIIFRANIGKKYLGQVDPNQHHIVYACRVHFQQKGMSLGGICEEAIFRNVVMMKRRKDNEI